METSYETKEPPIGTLDWWMRTLSPKVTEVEISERIRLTTLVFRSWMEARNLGPVEEGMPANFVCGYLLDAATQLLSKSRVDTREIFDRWLREVERGQEPYIEGFFKNVWAKQYE